MGEPPAPEEGAVLRRAADVGTGVIVVAGGAAAISPAGFGLAYAALSCGLFTIGTAALLWAYALGVSRSRTDDVSLPGLFFLSPPAAPSRVRQRFRANLAVEVVVVLVAAALRPFSVVAFGVLAPMFALGLMGVWGGRHGVFPPRPLRRAA